MRWRTRQYFCEQQLTLDLAIFDAARVPETCARGTPITIDGVTRTAGEWAAERGLKWQTVKMRRHRGDSWRQALSPELRRTPWMSTWTLAGRPQQERRASR